jgi:DNA-binding transcriptional MerR regulator
MATRHLTQNELAARWNVSPRTIERWRSIGEGPKFVRISNRVMFRIEDIEAFEKQHLLEANADAPLDETEIA